MKYFTFKLKKQFEVDDYYLVEYELVEIRMR